MNLLSIGAALGVTVMVFQFGWFPGVAPGPIEAFLPVLMFAIVFGLSMDYEVFLVSRIHEEWTRQHDHTAAVRDGLTETGRVITAAAAVMVVVFGSFIFGGSRVIALFGRRARGGGVPRRARDPLHPASGGAPAARAEHLGVPELARPQAPPLRDRARPPGCSAAAGVRRDRLTERSLIVRAFTLDSFDSTPGLRDDLPEPQAVDSELVVRVLASSANPVDAAIAGGVLRQMAEHDFPVTLGRDYAGIVEYAGSDTTRYRAGDEVYGFVPATNPTVHDGSWAELIVVPESGWVARKPASIELEAAGASPLAGITALAALDALQPADGETVLVIGATGGVGSFFVQLASLAGAHVVAPGLAEDADYLTGIGVGEILDRNADLATALGGRQVDAILDVVSFAPQETLLSASTRLASSNGAAGDGPGRFNLYAQPSPENLERLAGLLDAGTIRVSIQERFELAQAGEALGFLAAGHTRGKIAVSVA